MSEDYHYEMCSITNDLCEIHSCDRCQVAKQHEREEYEQDKINDFNSVTTFDRTVKLNGVEVTVNRYNIIAKVNNEILDMLKSEDNISKTPMGYNPHSLKQYPAFMKLKRYLNLGIPENILIDENKIAVFSYPNTIYLCAPRIFAD